MSKFRSVPKDFSDTEYLYAYVEDFLNTKIATQIRVLREQRGLTQEELAKKIGTKQSGIARLENVNYSSWKIETLKKLARALDVIFIGGFISLRTFLDEDEKFGRKTLEQPRHQDEIAEQKQEEEILPVASGGATREMTIWSELQKLHHPGYHHSDLPLIVDQEKKAGTSAVIQERILKETRHGLLATDFTRPGVEKPLKSFNPTGVSTNLIKLPGQLPVN